MTDENLLCRTYSALHRNQGLSFPISYTLCDVVAHWLQMGWCSHTLQEVRDSQPAAFCHKKAGETFWRVAVPCHLPNNLPLRAAAGFQGAADVNSHAMQEWHRRAILTECNPLEKLTLTEARRGKQRGTYTPSPPKKNGKAGVTVAKNCSVLTSCQKLQTALVHSKVTLGCINWTSVFRQIWRSSSKRNDKESRCGSLRGAPGLIPPRDRWHWYCYCTVLIRSS